MTTGQLRNKMRRLREEKEAEAEEEGGELNLVPYLDIVTNVVMFLLASVTAVQSLSNVNTTAPAYGSSSPGESSGPPPLNLTINISMNGFTVVGSGGVLKNDAGTVPTVPKDTNGSELPWKKLQTFIHKIKEQFPDEHNIILTANPEVPYDLVIQTMDWVRMDGSGKIMFPDVTLSAGVL
jgi:biopolymer transport protein ExbD